MERVEESCCSHSDEKLESPQVEGGVERENFETSTKDVCTGTCSEEGEGFPVIEGAGVSVLEKFSVVTQVPLQMDGAVVHSSCCDRGALHGDILETKENDGRPAPGDRKGHSINLERNISHMVGKYDCHSTNASFHVVEQINVSHSPRGCAILGPDDAVSGHELLADGSNHIENNSSDYVSIEENGNCSLLDEEPSIKNQSSLSSEEHNVVCAGVEKLHLANTELDIRGVYVPPQKSICLVLQEKPPVEILKENNKFHCDFVPLLPTRTTEVAIESLSNIGDRSCEDEAKNGSESILISSGAEVFCSLLKPKMDSVAKSDANCFSHCKECLDVTLDSRSSSMDKVVASLSLDKENSYFNKCKHISLSLNNGARQELQDDHLSSLKDGMQRQLIEENKAGSCDNPEEDFKKMDKASLEVRCHTLCLGSGDKDSSLFGKIASTSQEFSSTFAVYSNEFILASDSTTEALSERVFCECSGKEIKGCGLHTCSFDPKLSSCLQGNVPFAVDDTLPSCATRKDCCEAESGEVAPNNKPVVVNVFRRTNPRRAASSNNQTILKSEQLTQTESAAGEYKKRVKNSLPILSSEIRISSKVKGKRTSLNRLAKHSVWGGDANLRLIFKQADELLKYETRLSEVQDKTFRSVGAVAKQKTRKSRSARMSKTRCSFKANFAHQNDLSNPQPAFPVTNSHVKAQASSPNLGTPNEIYESYHKLSEENKSAVGMKLHQRNVQLGEKDLESNLTQDMSVDNVLGEFTGVSSLVESETLVEAINRRHLLDTGSSPDSDIYNPVIEHGALSNEAMNNKNQDSEESQNALPPQVGISEELNAHISSKSSPSPESASSLDTRPRYRNKKGKNHKKDNKAMQLEHHLQESNLSKDSQLYSENLKKDLKPNKLSKQGRKKEYAFASFKYTTKAISDVAVQDAITAEDVVLGKPEQESCKDFREVDAELEDWEVLGKDNGKGKESLQAVKSEGNNSFRSKGRSRSYVSVSCKRQDAHSKSLKQKGKLQISGKAKTEHSHKLGNDLEANESIDVSMTELALVESRDPKCEEQDFEASGGLEGLSLQERRAWVLCDDCHKWRAIPAVLADNIDETNCRWVCKDNSDLAFSDCSIPQEKTNSEINAELGISDASGDEDEYTRSPKSNRPVNSNLIASQPSSWTLIKTNYYTHRNRRNQSIDEIMVCDCKPPSDGSLGCQDTCLNRILNIECVKGTCPCGDLCSNQQFQRRKYTKFKWSRCGKKGFGLQLHEDVSCGQFLIEYVGEVLDAATYDARQKFYASRGQKHFYFMTLYGGEVIDACAKGNLGRFINHSCSPNCRTEKWMVNGEVCIGLFAIRGIKKDFGGVNHNVPLEDFGGVNLNVQGEEVTFDYNYERVVGAAAKKCFCGSSACKGYIGGDPLNAEVIVQGDSDDESPEPLMTKGVNEKEQNPVQKGFPDHTEPVEDKNTDLQGNDLVSQCLPSLPEPDCCQQSKDIICRTASHVSSFNNSFQNLEHSGKEEIIAVAKSDVQQSDSCLEILDDRKAKYRISAPTYDVEHHEVSRPESNSQKVGMSASGVNMDVASDLDARQKVSKPSFAKSSRSVGVLNKWKTPTKSLVAQKEKKISVSTGNNLRGVEKDLDDLLDADGGISRRKDATKGYLKLLFLTAAEGDKTGVASQSIRDLSLILDALLKTKSRMVLVDIINKNGLQMLHNIMKQNRNDYNRIPIIRKLLKVLEFLALKEILTPEHVNKMPSCSGVESFRESILKLTRHSDGQVHQFARSFRDKWIPRIVKPLEPANRDHMLQRSHSNWFQPPRFGFQLDQGARQSEAIVCVSEAVHQSPSLFSAEKAQETAHPSSFTDNISVSGTKKRKRKSRWDIPSEIYIQSMSNIDHRETDSKFEFQKQIAETQSVQTSSLYEAATMKYKLQNNINDELPPGFENGSLTEFQRQIIESHRGQTSSSQEAASMTSILQNNIDNEAPPGFETGFLSEFRKQDIGSDNIQNSLSYEAANTKSNLQNDSDDEGPPGFASTVLFESRSPHVTAGRRQERYIPRQSVSYGIPVTIVQKLGIFKSDGNGSLPDWSVAPGIPFHPFPPLPPYPRESRTLSTEIHEFSARRTGASWPEKRPPNNQYYVGPQATGLPPPSASREMPADAVRTQHSNPHTGGVPFNSSCQRSFQSHKLNNQRIQKRSAPWPQQGNGDFRSSIRRKVSDAGNERVHRPNWPREEKNVCSSPES